MQENKEYSRFFCGRPFRFYLPLNGFESNKYETSSVICDHIAHGSFNSQKAKQISSVSQCGIPCGKKSYRRKLPIKKSPAAAFKINSDKIFVKPELLVDVGCETPRINYSDYCGKYYRYFYAMSNEVDTTYPGCLIKVDTLCKTYKRWYEENVYPSEPIFVPNPKQKNEDDGVILSALIWGQGRESEVGLLILNATSFHEIARVRFVTMSVIPKCLHGWFINQI